MMIFVRESGAIGNPLIHHACRMTMVECPLIRNIEEHFVI
jgi:hypothetical protein